MTMRDVLQKKCFVLERNVIIGCYYNHSFYLLIIALLIPMGKLKLWTAQEDNILIATSTLNVSKKWKKASQELRKRGYERSDIECRQRFVNHLDPNVSKGSWSDEELEILYNKFTEYGNKWFLLQKHLPGRTQTKIKNYFYGNIRFLLKIIIKFILNIKAGFINDIKTETLLDIYQGKNDFDGIQLIEKTIKRLNYRVDKKSCERLIAEHREVFQMFAKDYLMNASEALKSEEDQSECHSQENGEDQKVQGQCTEKNVTQILLISSVEGKVNEPEGELDYLQKMSKMHYEWYLHYQKAYEQLMSKPEAKAQDLTN